MKKSKPIAFKTDNPVHEILEGNPNAAVVEPAKGISKEDLEWYKNASLFDMEMQKALKREQRKEKIRNLFKRKKDLT